MGGRSSKSGAGGAGGGAVMGVAVAAPAPPTPAPPPTPAQRLDQLRQSINTYQDFANLSYDDKMDLMDEALKTPVPAGKPNTAYQQLAEYLGFDTSPPTVVTDAQLDRMGGTVLYRTVCDVGSVTATNIVTDTLRKNDTPFYSDTGGSVHGRGLYFATDLNDSRIYGDPNSKTFRGKIKPTAKVITETALDNEYRKAKNGHNRLARTLNKLSWEDGISYMAAYKGYDVIDTQNYGGYHTVLNRNAVVYSSTAKHFPHTYRTGNTTWGKGTSNITV